jgi:predicted outer membrane repeat protein
MVGIFRPPPPRRHKLRPRSTFKPRLEVLEDRFCPATDYVTTSASSGAGSLPQVIANAAANDTIAFQIPQLKGEPPPTILLNSDITINKPLTINGLNWGTAGQSVTVSGGTSNGIFAITTDQTVEIDNLTLSYGNVAGNGGAISDSVADGSTLNLNNDTFSNNQAEQGNGGAIFYSTNQGMLNLNGDTFTSNIAVGNNGQGNGGAVYGAGNVSISNNTIFTGNTADQNGGAIYAGPLSGRAGSGDMSVQNSQFNMNGKVVTIGQTSAGVVNNGGAIYASGSTVNLTDDSLTSNTANGSGGAVYATPGTYNNVSLDVYASSFLSNAAGEDSNIDSQGGAIFTQDPTSVTGPATATTPPAQFIGNQTTGSGGAIAYVPIQNTSSTLTVEYITFSGNIAGQYGGALFDYVKDASTNATDVDVEVSGSLFNGNKATDSEAYGGAIYVAQNTWGQASTSFTAVNSTFYQNKVLGDLGDGGAIADESVNGGAGSNTITLTSLTVTGNTAGQYGGGLYIAGTTPAIDNSIIALNALQPGEPANNGPDVYGTISSSGYNVVGMDDGSTGWNAFLGDHTGTSANPLNPGLASGLADNGENGNTPATQTIALLTTSNYYELGDPNQAGQPDQRGYIRQANLVSPGAEDPDA